MTLPKQQKAAYDFIKSFSKKNGRSPTSKELASHLGNKSPRLANLVIQALADKGFVSRESKFPFNVTVL